jgi:hypothetical protein
MNLHISAGLLGVALLGGAGCGSSSGNAAGDKFCTDYATAFCTQQYTCTPAAMRDANFQTFYGTTVADCVKMWEFPCAQPSNSDVNCASGKHVNQAAATICLSAINGDTCDDITGPGTGYSTECQMVCGAATTGAGGTGTGAAGAGGTGTGAAGAGGNGTGAAGTAGTGAGGTSGGSTPATPTAFCNDLNAELCIFTFQCTAVADRTAYFTSLYGSSVAECETLQGTSCPTATCNGYDAASAATCLSEFTSATCANYLYVVYAVSCNAACPA